MVTGKFAGRTCWQCNCGFLDDFNRQKDFWQFFRHKARVRSNSCKNWSKLTGMARSGILNELEVRDFD